MVKGFMASSIPKTTEFFAFSWGVFTTFAKIVIFKVQ